MVSLSIAGAMAGRVFGIVSQDTLDQVGVLALGWATIRLTQIWGQTRAALSGIVAVASLQLIWLAGQGLTLMPYLLVVPSNLVVAWLFARGLLPGREPILLRLIRLMNLRPIDDPRFVQFVRWQCWLWSGLALGTALLAFAAILVAAQSRWIDDMIVAMVAVQLGWFLLSHYYASMRYRRPETWQGTIRAMSRPDVWARLTSS